MRVPSTFLLAGVLIDVLFDRPTDTIGDLKKLAAAHLGTKAEKLVIKRQQYTILKDHISLEDYEIQDGSGLELYFQ